MGISRRRNNNDIEYYLTHKKNKAKDQGNIVLNLYDTVSKSNIFVIKLIGNIYLFKTMYFLY